MKIGIFGGTFNPVHIGHLRTVEEARDFFKLEKIIFIPANIPPHKSTEELIPAEERLKILNFAISDNPFFSSSDIELNREGKSYTYFTLLELKKIYPNDEIYMIIGKDSFYDFTTWYCWEKILDLTNVIVLNRKLYKRIYPEEEIHAKKLGYKKFENYYINSSNMKLFIFNNSIIEVSSTKIRENFRKNISNKYLIPEKALKYILEKKFYS